MSPHRSNGTESFFSLPMVFIDVETTGDSLAEGGEICEAGLVKVDPHDGQTLAELHVKFAIHNPRGRSEDELSYHRYTGFTFAEWHDTLPVNEALAELNTFCSGCSPWAYNVSFERRWLADYFLAHGNLEWLGDYHWFDLMTLARHVLLDDYRHGKITKLSLSSVGQYLGLGEEPKPHRGIIGARYEVEVYRRLLARS